MNMYDHLRYEIEHDSSDQEKFEYMNVLLGEKTPFAAISRVIPDKNGNWSGFIVFKDARFSPIFDDVIKTTYIYPAFMGKADNKHEASRQAAITWRYQVRIFCTLLYGVDYLNAGKCVQFRDGFDILKVVSPFVGGSGFECILEDFEGDKLRVSIDQLSPVTLDRVKFICDEYKKAENTPMIYSELASRMVVYLTKIIENWGE